jgi:DNA-binding protein H-NS
MEINPLDDVASSSNELGAVSELAERQLQLEDDIVALEEQLKQAKQDLKRVAEQDLPELMQSLNIKEFKLNDGTRVTVNDIVSGSIPSQGAIDKAKGDKRDDLKLRQERCFSYLRKQKASSMIKNIVEVQFQSGEDDKCSEFKEHLSETDHLYSSKAGVHPSSLNAWLKEQISEGKNVPYEDFKIFTGNRAKIERK